MIEKCTVKHWKTFSLCSFCNVRDQDSHPHKTTYITNVSVYSYSKISFVNTNVCVLPSLAMTITRMGGEVCVCVRACACVSCLFYLTKLRVINVM